MRRWHFIVAYRQRRCLTRVALPRFLHDLNVVNVALHRTWLIFSRMIGFVLLYGILDDLGLFHLQSYWSCWSCMPTTCYNGSLLDLVLRYRIFSWSLRVRDLLCDFPNSDALNLRNLDQTSLIDLCQIDRLLASSSWGFWASSPRLCSWLAGSSTLRMSSTTTRVRNLLRMSVQDSFRNTFLWDRLSNIHDFCLSNPSCLVRLVRRASFNSVEVERAGFISRVFLDIISKYVELSRNACAFMRSTFADQPYSSVTKTHSGSTILSLTIISSILTLRRSAVSTNRLRYRDGNKGVSRWPWFCRVGGGVACCLLWATHGLLHCVGTGVPGVSLPGHTSVPSNAQAGWHREQSANPVREVGASTVVLSSIANVFVTLSSVMVFPHSETAVLVFCDMLEYLHEPCLRI